MMRAPYPAERRTNWLIRQRVERIVGRMHIGEIRPAQAAWELKQLMLNADTAVRILNRVPAGIDFERVSL
ncbi:MAG TPA: hypothetical protein PK620_06475 [Denitromonas sp.]|nr:hypothetical protein [Zoogloeaceae bacterium]HQU90329.1 hypothetical protein [Denitromonas sp.]HQV14542.1 hypothetical protein [Denitromonas sp.]